MEQSFLAYLRGRCRSLRQVPVGIGDDAAVLDPVAGQQVATVDQIIAGTDFLPEDDLGDVGYKAMAINLSDLAAMGATPTAALVTLSLPKQNATRIAAEVYEGILQAAEAYNVAIAGGDISTYEGPLSITITILGEVPAGSAWLRSGAQEADAIIVTGYVGGSIRGRHLRPEPRVDLALRLREVVQVHAAIDISDGLSLDLDRLCAASHVGAELSIETIPIHDDAIGLAEETGKTPFQHAWSDGEDFELILTMGQSDADKILNDNLGVQLTQIGNIVGRTGLWKRKRGKLERMSPQGYIHSST